MTTALTVTAALLTWLIAALALGMLIGRTIRARNQQIPRHSNLQAG